MSSNAEKPQYMVYAAAACRARAAGRGRGMMRGLEDDRDGTAAVG